ncbi:MAG: (Fe-S)-binding protein [Candidatus Bipolaricaulota bacterium]
MPAILVIGHLTGKLIDREEIMAALGERENKVNRFIEVLPNHNCGACGYENCAQYARAVASGEASPDLCHMGGEGVEKKLRDIVE